MTHTILLALGIFTLCAFYPFTAISFQKYRLPKKEKEYLRNQHLLFGDKGILSDEDVSIEKNIFQADFDGTDYILPVSFVTLFCAMGFYVLFSGKSPIILWGAQTVSENNLIPYDRLSLVSLSMAILGSHVWAIQYIVRRLITLDLAPGAYYSVGTRIILATFVSLVLRHFIACLPVKDPMIIESQIPAIAFFTDIFPQRAMQYMQDKLKIFGSVSGKAHNLSLDMIEGISLFSKVRLAEIGIDNAQNLALANFKVMMLKTPFTPRLILDWIAQAKLYIMVKDGITELRKAGIRNVFSLIRAYDQGGLEELEALSTKIGTDLPLACTLLKERPDIVELLKIRERVCVD